MDNNIPRDNSGSVQWTSKRKKKVSKRETIKRRKVSGEPHIDHVGRPKSGISTGRNCRCKRLQCFSRLTTEQRQEILKIFYKYENKNDQDAHLTGLISYKSVQQRRPRQNRDEEDDSFSHDLAYYYKVRTHNEEIPVCVTAFMSLHGITRGRLRTIQTKVSSGQLPKDGRGKHTTRAHAVPLPILELIKSHIKTFKGRQSHYSLRDNPNVVFLPEDLSVKKMHELFLSEVQIRVSYIVYYLVFTKHFNIKFGLPRSDTCSICDELNLKILRETDASTKNELNIKKNLHLQKAKKFRELKNVYKEKAKRGECMLLSFDYMQNLPLPHIKTSYVFYSRQMWYYVFGVHNLSNNDATMYCYTEITGKKGASDVTSLLLHYLNNNDITSENLILLSDGCSGQNKNHVMVYFQYFLVHVLKLFKTVKHIFPVRGHTYLPNDADFALIGKNKRVCSPEIPADWDKIIEAARTYPTPFKVVSATQDLFFNMKDAMTPYFLKVPRPALRLRQVRIIITNEKYQHIKVKETFSGPSTRSEIRRKVRLPSEFTLDPLYMQPIKMTAGKIANLLNLSKYLSKPENQDYYRQICINGDNGINDVDNEVDVEEDDNSDGCE